MRKHLYLRSLIFKLSPIATVIAVYGYAGDYLWDMNDWMSDYMERNGFVVSEVGEYYTFFRKER